MPQLTDVEQMRRQARAACDFTRRKLVNGNENVYGGIPATHPRSNDPNQIDCIKQAVGQAYATTLARGGGDGDPLQETLCDAKIALGLKAGNCDQHASVAFAYLFAHDVWPIYKVILPGHAFVVLGYPSAFAICDPWADRSDGGSDVVDWLRHVWGPNAPNFWMHRVLASSTGPGGSEQMFLRYTADQEAGDGMDFSA